MSKKAPVAGLICQRPQGLGLRDDFSDISGGVLQSELLLAGLRLTDLRATYLWSQDPPDDESGMNVEIDRVLKLLKPCRWVLLLGTQVTGPFLFHNAGDVSGLWTESPYLPGKKCIAAPSPETLVRGTVGEFRLALGRFAKVVKKVRE